MMGSSKLHDQADGQTSSAFKNSRVRGFLRKSLFQFLRQVSETDDAREMWSKTLKGQLAWRSQLPLKNYADMIPPYVELGKSQHDVQLAQRTDVIIITGRFRSGSTLLWNLFRNIEGMTSYYEPFNERRWFDPRTRGNRVDRTHKNVADYWREYEGLEVLGEYYCEEWIEKNLYMDETFWAPKMKRYVELMIEKAPGRPVLQFNRIDFRLPWFRQNFPHAPIIHIYRHPRDQWCSALLNPDCFPKDGTMDQFAPYDKFYLRMWARDLKYHFPFLDEQNISHPYQMFYYLWKLSYLFGVTYAHHSIAFEHLVDNPELHLKTTLQALHVEQYNLEQLKLLFDAPPREKWRMYADDDWFKRQETLCETILADFFPTVTTRRP
jgi:hypothetical protein